MVDAAAKMAAAPRPESRLMTTNFCTLFDANYLPRGLALYRSLERVCPDFRLWIFCMDEPTRRVLEALELPAATLVSLSELEEHDAALLSIRSTRTAVEYCWTATPSVCKYVLETTDVDAVTYVDADVFFFSDPQPLFDELGDDAVMIVPHRYAPQYRHKEPETGTFNVQWLTFKRDPDALATLEWWHERCIEWCYHRWEDGKIGDQGYLNDFQRLFDRVHVLEHPGGGLAPWNVSAYRLGERDGLAQVDGKPLVFYHHHSLRLYKPSAAARLAIALGRLRSGVPPLGEPWITNYPVEADERRLVWEPYLRALGEATIEVERTAPGVVPKPPEYPVAELARAAARRARRAVRSVDPAGFAPGALRRYRESWRSSDVASQMLALTDKQLTEPESVAPYRAFAELLAFVVEDPELPRPATFLDIGCGMGAYGELLERHAPGRFAYTGADFSREILDVARTRWPERRFEQRDLFEPGATDGFDVVFASALVDVLAEPERALDMLLGADARLAILHRQRIGSRERVSVVPGYRGQRTYSATVTLDQLEAAAERHGRRIAESVPVDDNVQSFVLVRGT
jgi:SAM-dependent methyltransferase